MRTDSSNTMGSTSPLARDIQNVVTDAQDLLKTVQSEGQSKLTDVKAKVQQQLDSAKQMLGQIQTTVNDGAKAAMDTTDAYVRSNPWRAIGISAALGALIGFLAARR
jgi:ElaB protein